MLLEDLTKGATVKGILPNQVVTVVDVKWFGSDVIELTYKDASGRPGNELLYRDREPTLEIVTQDRPWSFNADYELSDQEAVLYKQVTEYVREEFNRADALDNQGRKGTVGPWYGTTAVYRSEGADRGSGYGDSHQK